MLNSKLPKILLLVVLATSVLIAGNALADSSPIKLLVNSREVKPDVPPQLINGRIMVPVRWVAEALGADVSWENESRVVKITTSLKQLTEILSAAEGELDSKGTVQKIWRINDGSILLEQVWNRDYKYHLYDKNTNKTKLIVGPIENARFQQISDDRLIFVAKGGGDCGNYSFPYLLSYDLEKGKLSRNEMFLQQDVAFGSIGAWKHVLKDIKLKNNELVINLTVAKDQTLAGGHYNPFTVVDYENERMTMRVYNVTCSKNTHKVLKVNHPIIEKIEWKAFAADVPVDNSLLLKSDFPYGAALDNYFFLPGGLFNGQLRFK